MVNSNPESTFNWYKLTNSNNNNSNSNVSSSSSSNLHEVLLDGANQQSKYQIHKFKQSNQTVSYLKIKVCLIKKFTFN